MQTILKLLGSMRTMAGLMLIFAFSVGTATFIENDFGTETAKAVVYNAKWFELLLTLLAINLVLNILNFRMYRKERALVLLFHVSFFVVLIGATITRYWGFEGVMHIREGALQNEMLSAENHLGFVIESEGKRESYSVPLYLSKITQNTQRFSTEVGVKSFEARIVEYIPDATQKLVAVDEGGEAIASLMITGEGMAPSQILLHRGERFETEEFILSFEADGAFEKPVIALHVSGDTLQMSHSMALGYLNMDDRSSGEINASEVTPLESRRLYNHGRSSFVLRDFYPQAKAVLASADAMGSMATNLRDALRLSLRLGDEEREVWVRGVRGMMGEPIVADFGDARVSVTYGAKVIRLPFAIKLVDFQLERYPGSNSPSSYASEVVLMDEAQGIEQPFRIYMNHVLDHRGYRFFQSSYDRDELGTVLSVNNDPGTLPTYIGYAMMAIGMFGALFVSGGRFSRLAKKAKEASLGVLALGMLYGLLPASLHAEKLDPIIERVLSFDKAHAQRFGALIVQDAQGRMKPMDTLSSEIVAKVNRGSSILGLTPNQIVLGMMLSPDAWREISMIRTGNEALNEILGIDAKAKHTSFSQFFEFPSEMGGYKLATHADEASRKTPSKRNILDKAIVQADERVNVAYMVYTGALLRIWPAPGDANQRWMATIEALQSFDAQSAEVVRQLAVNYFNAIDEGIAKGNWAKADVALEAIIAHQKSVGAAVYPSEAKIETERIYNVLNIFERLWPWFFLVGFVLLFLSFGRIIQPKLRIEWATRITMALLILFFIALSAGLAMRWYISGHAPWSDGYESLIYISWATVLAGFIFSKNSPITLAATGILAGLTLFVAHLSWMDPQITNLVPVLKSYWLSIHVSMITGSYGFLGLGALLGFIVLILFNLKNPANEKRISASIKELGAINEMSLMIGLVMLTVGNFLGGVWANESWGRYWGWDPKETWALVTILVYAVVIHLRFIKSVYSDYAFAAISLLAFTSVLMTYFGVNYYLAGMHSYAKGDPVPVPGFVPVTYSIVFAIIALAYRNRRLASM